MFRLSRWRIASIRGKLAAHILVLLVLWSFGAWATVGDGLQLAWLGTLNVTMRKPAVPLTAALQAERELTVGYLSGPDESRRQALEAQRRETVALAAEFKASAQSWKADLAATNELERQVDDVVAALDGLAETRAQVDARSIGPRPAAQAFTGVMDRFFVSWHLAGRVDNEQISREIDILTALNRAWELMSQEDALMTGVMASGRMTQDQQARVAYLTGAWRQIAADAIAELPVPMRARGAEVAAGPAVALLRALEDKIVATRAGAAPVDAAQWNAAMDPAAAEIREVVIAGTDDLLERTSVLAAWVGARFLVITVLGLIAVIVLIRFQSHQVRQLTRLQTAAQELADKTLPDVVARLGRGEQVDVAKEAPPLNLGDDEIGQVAKAFNAAAASAVKTAVEQAELRRGIRAVLLHFAQRLQALLHRQIDGLGELEQSEENPDTLARLYHVDHLANRMRRNAENLVVLSGATPARGWRRPQPVIDVVRAAMGEVESYERVKILHFGPVTIVGPAVRDLTHLLAELIENALSFSPPTTEVEVGGQMVGNGYAVEIEDRGLGMIDVDLDAANAQVTGGLEFRLEQRSLGLHVASQLAARHGVRVQLKHSPYGGITAVVLIPATLVTDQAQPVAAVTGQAGDAPVPQLATAPAPRPAVPVAPASTPGGLPVRVRQTHLAAPLREPKQELDDTVVNEPVDPETVRRRISSYQANTRRARRDAADLRHDDQPQSPNE